MTHSTSRHALLFVVVVLTGSLYSCRQSGATGPDVSEAARSALASLRADGVETGVYWFGDVVISIARAEARTQSRSSAQHARRAATLRADAAFLDEAILRRLRPELSAAGIPDNLAKLVLRDVLRKREGRLVGAWTMETGVVSNGADDQIVIESVRAVPPEGIQTGDVLHLDGIRHDLQIKLLQGHLPASTALLAFELADASVYEQARKALSVAIAGEHFPALAAVIAGNGIPPLENAPAGPSSTREELEAMSLAQLLRLVDQRPMDFFAGDALAKELASLGYERFSKLVTEHALRAR